MIQRRCARAATSGTMPPDGAWSATDPGELGFIKLAQETRPALVPSKKVRLSLSIRSGNAAGEVRSGNDAASLAGAIRGDDGKGIGALRVGAHVFTSVVGIERLKIDGKVDMAWFERRIAELGALDTGP